MEWNGPQGEVLMAKRAGGNSISIQFRGVNCTVVTVPSQIKSRGNEYEGAFQIRGEKGGGSIRKRNAV